MITFGG